MNIYTAQQIRQADAYTIAKEPIPSIDLMERASRAFVKRFVALFTQKVPVHIFCGPGNNGGDGLAIARLLNERGWVVNVTLVQFSTTLSVDCEENLNRLMDLNRMVRVVKNSREALPEVNAPIVIDALFGSGLNRPLSGWAAQVVAHINALNAEVVAVDMPSGLFAEFNEPKPQAVKADYTISFEWHKLSFMDDVCLPFVGHHEVVPIGLHPDFITENPTTWKYFDRDNAQLLWRERTGNVHKGTFGCLGVVAGNAQSMGAALLATKAAFRAGAGVVVANIIEPYYHAFYASVPEAMMAFGGKGDYISELNLPRKVNAVVVGPALGITVETKGVLKQLLVHGDLPLVIDADGLTILAEQPDWWKYLKGRAVLTPHIGEWKRFGMQLGNFEQTLNELKEFAELYECVVVLKGPKTKVAYPNGVISFNSSGNAGLATAGSGDVLSGIIGAMVAQGYALEHAASLGVYVHGMSADLAVESNQSPESLMASDVIQFIGRANKLINNS